MISVAPDGMKQLSIVTKDEKSQVAAGCDPCSLIRTRCGLGSNGNRVKTNVEKRGGALKATATRPDASPELAPEGPLSKAEGVASDLTLDYWLGSENAM
jgi:hypothetical protein